MHARIHVEGDDEFVVQSLHDEAEDAVRIVVFRRTDDMSTKGHGHCAVVDDDSADSKKGRVLGGKHDSHVHGGSLDELASEFGLGLAKMILPTSFFENPLLISVPPPTTPAAITSELISYCMC
jgi:hypothetical protein